MNDNRTIAAIATGEGGAISVIRVSGQDAIAACDTIFRGVNGKRLSGQHGFTLHYGNIVDSFGELVDDVIVSLFRSPSSYTGEDMVEISCHSSQYIKSEIMRLLLENGVSMALPGEFTLRAFVNGKMDLSQAEAVADVIASSNKSSHELAVNQMRGGYSAEFQHLRDRLMEITSLLELELDFSEEDVEFADRSKLAGIINEISTKISVLRESFRLGNAIKNGVPVAIVGSPNAGKSTLLNALLKEDKAMVSDIAGTTRDIIEDSINIGGIEYRFIDTAGIRETEDMLESMGIERTFQSVSKADIIMLVADAGDDFESVDDIIRRISLKKNQHLIVLLNKIDKYDPSLVNFLMDRLTVTSLPIIPISAKEGLNVDKVTSALEKAAGLRDKEKSVVVSNVRHYEALNNAHKAILDAQNALHNDVSADLLAEDMREVIFQLGLITGEITTDEILGNIFSNFCIGK